MKVDFMRYVLSIAVVTALLVLSLWVLVPFLAAGVWAAMIVVATWPILIKLQASLGGRRLPAVLIMTLAILLLLVVPLWVAITTVADHSDGIVALAKDLMAGGVPSAPAWIESLPWVGGRLADFWNDAAASGMTALVQEYVAPHFTDAGHWAIGKIGGLGGLLVQFFLMTLLAALMYARGEAAADLACQFGRRIGGQRGLAAVVLTAKAIRSVALGVGLTALVQSLLGTLGLALAGIPYAGLLGAVMLLLCIAQIGPSLVMVPAVIWLFWKGDQMAWSVFLTIWSVFVIMLDNVLRPWLIRRGADLPLLLILLGVIGGLLTFGLIGIFVGPVVLAVTYTLMIAWLDEDLGANLGVTGLSSHQENRGQPQENKETQ